MWAPVWGTQLSLGVWSGSQCCGLPLGMMSYWRARCAALSCHTVCPGPQSCSSRLSRPCQLWCQGCRSFGLLGKGRGLSGQGLARIGVWHCGNGLSIGFGITSSRLSNFKLLPCWWVWRVSLGVGWSCCGEFLLGKAFWDQLGMTAGLGVGLVRRLQHLGWCWGWSWASWPASL